MSRNISLISTGDMLVSEPHSKKDNWKASYKTDFNSYKKKYITRNMRKA